MKKRVVAGILATVMSITCLAGFGSMEAKAANDTYALSDCDIHDGYDNHELLIGDTPHYILGDLYKNGAKMNPADWHLDSVNPFLEDVSGKQEIMPEEFYEETKLPESAFGKYFGMAVVIEELDYYLPCYSRYTIHAWGEENEYTVEKIDDSSVMVFSIYGGKNVNFKSKVTVNNTEYDVVSIGDGAIESGADTMISATLPVSITEIGKQAFYNAKKLKNITINGKLTYVGENAFKGINSKAVFKIKANKKNFNKMVKMIKKAGAPKKATFKRVK